LLSILLAPQFLHFLLPLKFLLGLHLFLVNPNLHPIPLLLILKLLIPPSPLKPPHPRLLPNLLPPNFDFHQMMPNLTHPITD